MSQYALAGALGWPRAKIKRLERGETVSIQQSDLDALEAMFAGGASAQKKAPRKSAPEKKAAPRPKTSRRKLARPEELFTSVKRLPRPRGAENIVFFRVKMKVEKDPEALFGLNLELDGTQGRINGVAHTKKQIPLRVGDQVDIMLWGLGIARQ
jgi:hypothetical protein